MLKSNFALGMNYNLDKFAIENLFKPIISNFIYSQIEVLKEFRILEAEKYISSYDFKKYQIVPMEDIYLSFLDKIQYVEERLDIPISVFITFDKRQCPDYCSKSNKYFSSIKIGGVSKVYYILFTTDELFDFLYSNQLGYVRTKEENISDYEHESKDFKSKYIKGYLDNHNIDKGFSFVICPDDLDYRIYHREFPNISDIKVGSILELEIDSSNIAEKVVEYRLSEDKEIQDFVQFFDGILQKVNANAYINTHLQDVKTIFVPSKIAKNFEEGNDVSVFCLASRKIPVEENQYNWVALQVIEKD